LLCQESKHHRSCHWQNARCGCHRCVGICRQGFVMGIGNLKTDPKADKLQLGSSGIVTTHKADWAESL
jgi:hypothetical protein